MGDGRSGSTLLEGVLSNIPGSICVGESYRFCNRFSRNETLCGCSEQIGNCELWSQVADELQREFGGFTFAEFNRKQKELLKASCFTRIPQISSSPDWTTFIRFSIAFYRKVSEISGRHIIVDSSKSVSWAYFLQHLDAYDLHVVHLERNLQAVANSWKKKVLMPEHISKDVFMPIKSNALILKTWLKVKLLSLAVHKKGPVLFVEHERLCRRPKELVCQLESFVEEPIWHDKLRFNRNHGVAGNPVRFTRSDEIRFHEPETRLRHLNGFEKICFTSANLLGKRLLSPNFKRLANLPYSKSNFPD